MMTWVISSRGHNVREFREEEATLDEIAESELLRLSRIRITHVSPDIMSFLIVVLLAVGLLGGIAAAIALFFIPYS